jgi:hypothetical protein
LTTIDVPFSLSLSLSLSLSVFFDSGRLISPQQLTFSLQKPQQSPEPNNDINFSINTQLSNNYQSNTPKSTKSSISQMDLDRFEGAANQIDVGWYLYADLYCLDYDGNVFDCALIALLAALHNGFCPPICFFILLFGIPILIISKNFDSVRLPTLSIDPKGEDILASSERTLKLSLNSHPIAVTFGIFEEYKTSHFFF